MRANKGIWAGLRGKGVDMDCLRWLQILNNEENFELRNLRWTWHNYFINMLPGIWYFQSIELLSIKVLFKCFFSNCWIIILMGQQMHFIFTEQKGAGNKKENENRTRTKVFNWKLTAFCFRLVLGDRQLRYLQCKRLRTRDLLYYFLFQLLLLLLLLLSLSLSLLLPLAWWWRTRRRVGRQSWLWPTAFNCGLLS